MSGQATVPAAQTLDVPELSLVVLVGASGSGKSTFAPKHFLATEVLSSDRCRALVSDDENDQGATGDAFELLHFIAAKRMAAGRLTVVDATNVKREDRARLVRLAREHHFLPVAIVFDLPERLCKERDASRSDRDLGAHVIRNQVRDLRRGLRGLRKEGFRHVHTLASLEAVEAAQVRRTRLWNNRSDEQGPFDIIGDVHGCCDELEALLGELGYEITEQRDGAFPDGGPVYAHPEGRVAVFVGDLVDRGPRILDTVRLVRNMVAAGSGQCVPGNHDVRHRHTALKRSTIQPAQTVHYSTGLDSIGQDTRRPAAR
jgi:protein phosphatase